MATKKEKRLRAQQKREAYLAAERQVGLDSLAKDRERRKNEEREEWRAQHEKKHSWKKRIKECPLCQDEMQKAKRNVPIAG